MNMLYLARSATGEPLLGDDEGFVPLTAAAPPVRTVNDALGHVTEGLAGPEEASAIRVPGDSITFGAPIDRPPQLWGIGLNYTAHATDLDETRPEAPASFLQPPHVLCGPGGPIRLPSRNISDEITAEAELGVVIGRTCKDVPVEEAGRVIAGYVCVIDVTAEDLVKQNPRFLTRSKRFDSFLVLGPWIACPQTPEFDAIDEWVIDTVVNDEIVATNSVDEARFSPFEIVSELSQDTTLDPGTIIATGTPGAGQISPGDTVRADIDPIGSVSATVTR